MLTHGQDSPAELQPIPAGDFSSWLHHAQSALLTNSGIDVPCGGCVGCCSSAYFIHVKPTDSAARDRISKDLLFPAPGMPVGHAVMGFDHNGRCPMLNVKRCSIYEHRPLTCRAYDCRIFAAAGILAGGEDKAAINQRIQRWEFRYPSISDRVEHLAVQAAASFVQKHASAFPGGRVPTEPGQLAILAIKTYRIFLESEGNLTVQQTKPSAVEIANAVIFASKEFDARISSECL